MSLNFPTNIWKFDQKCRKVSFYALIFFKMWNMHFMHFCLKYAILYAFIHCRWNVYLFAFMPLSEVLDRFSAWAENSRKFIFVCNEQNRAYFPFWGWFLNFSLILCILTIILLKKRRINAFLLNIIGIITFQKQNLWPKDWSWLILLTPCTFVSSRTPVCWWTVDILHNRYKVKFKRNARHEM